MHLKSLELIGFKSFADKTVFDFHEGITAIVGPNGCGKSNVLDAVRWVLGEQSAKALRGGEMADVIFNGTDKRKPVGFAEVSLTFSDCAADLAVDWHEVRVTRRVYRDGNSDYLLNKNLCRLKDIQNLFADTGVGRTAYSIMEQGKIDLVLSSRPEDRRSVFEEAAGITKYKSQKKEALRKLEATEANLLRVGDIIKEIKRQIGSLQRQAGKARRYQALHADLKVLDTHFAYRKMQTLERELAECAEKLERIGATERETRKRIETDEQRVSHLREQLDEIDAQITATRGELQRHQSEIASHKHRIEFNQRRGAELRELIEKHESEIDSAETKLAEQQSALAAATALIEETARLLEGNRTEVSAHDSKVAELRRARAEHDRALQELQVAIAKDEAKRAALETELGGLRERRAASATRVTELEAAVSAASSGHERLEAHVRSARDAIQAEAQSIEQLQQNVSDAEADVDAQQRELNELEKRLANVERAIAEKQSRIEVLRQLNEEGEGLAQGSQALLKGSEFADAFGGALAAQLDVDPEYVRAIEAALGRNIQAVILIKPELASDVVHHINSRQLGQAALLLPQSGETESAKSLPNHAICWAAERVRAAEAIETFINRLLHRTAIFQNIDDALAAKSVRPEIAAATLNGEFISHDGVLFGGTAAGRSNSMLERNARIAALETEHTRLLQERDESIADVERLRASHASAIDRLATARSTHSAAIASQNAATARASALEREHFDASHKLEALRSDSATLSRQIEEADARLDELELQIDATSARVAESQNALTKLQTTRDEALLSEEDAIARAAELRLVVASHEQKHQSLLGQQEPMLARERELADAITSRKSDIALYQERIATGEREITEAQHAIEAQTAFCTQLEQRIEQLNAERSGLNDEISALENTLRQTRNSLNELHDQRAAEQVRQTQLQLQREHLAEHITQRYQLEMREFMPDSYAYNKVLAVQLKRASRNADEATEPAETSAIDIAAVTDEQLQTLITDLTRQLDNMGPVNLDAVQEYDELEERHKFLETQLNDLTNSKRELLDVIARINSTTQKLFADTFAQVRINFREMFAELFGGGRADLQLLDEGNPLECGIDIIAKPPGKQLQSVSLLSGGERTMTAVALLFAIYMVRPSPFCVLDEMDAPLDESNINRFIKVLERFVEQSQFIIITHNKRTIAKADILYGVTMEERGVSKLVGMKMAPAPARDTAVQPSVAAPSQQQQFAIEENDDAKLAAR